MALISSARTSSSSSFTTPFKHDAFLSFYGKDTRNSFTDHLYNALKEKGIDAFRDNEKLERGTFIAPELMKAIEESKFAIVILSENYASSRWCLDELVKIVACMEETGLTVLPIFYHVDPSDVRQQTGTYAVAFAEHEKNSKVNPEKIQTWKEALKRVGNIAGWDVKDRPESKVIQETIGRIRSQVNRKIVTVCKDLVAINSRKKEMIKFLDLGSNDVRFIGIWGMGGVGKTTLIKAIYNTIYSQFEASSFIGHVSEKARNPAGLVSLQKQLLYEILMERKIKICDFDEGTDWIRKRLQKIKVFIVLDDVDEDKQLEALVGSHDWFGLGSRIIITSIDKHLLKRKVDYIYEVKKLDHDDALELFSQRAFKKPYPEKDYVDLSNKFVRYAQGLPLALEVLGSSLFDRTRKAWEDALDALKENPNKKIMDILEVGYQQLEPTAQNLFLDIVCFFKGEDKDRVADLLKGSRYNMDVAILEDRSLITILGKKLWMHDLLQEMGRDIVRHEAPQEPGRRSRLWHYKDTFHVLKNNTGTISVEGMVLNSYPPTEDLNVHTFTGMERLRLIRIITNVHLPRGLNYLSNELRLMEWHKYPLKYMPRSFEPKNLVELIMPHSCIKQLPEGFGNLENLKLMDLSDSQYIIKTPNFKGFPNIERLIFQGCTRLYVVHSSIGTLKHLTLLNLKDCKSLNSFPHEINLESLSFLILSGCSRFKTFPEVGSNMTRLSNLYLNGTAIEELPLSIKHLTGLTLLNLRECKNLSKCPSIVCSLTSLTALNLSGCKGQAPKFMHLFGLCFCAEFVSWGYGFFIDHHLGEEPIKMLVPKSFSGLSSLFSLDLSDCNLSDTAFPKDLSCLSSLQYLDLSKNNFTCLPHSFSQISQLKFLYLDNCTRLQSFPNLPSSTEIVMARECTSLENFSNQVVIWTSGETTFTFINCLSWDEDEKCRTSDFSLVGKHFREAEDEEFRNSEISLVDIRFQRLWQIYMMERIYQSNVFYLISPQTEIPAWFNYQSPESSVKILSTSDTCDDSARKGIAICAIFVVDQNLIEASPCQDLEYFHEFICHFDADGGPVDCPIVLNIPKDKYSIGSFGVEIYILHSRFRDYLEKCSYISSSITTNSPSVKIRECGGRILSEKDMEVVLQNSKAQSPTLRSAPSRLNKMDKAESSQSNDRLRRKLMPLLLRVYQGDLARNHKYDYVFPHMSVPDWFSNRSFCSEIRIKLPTNLELDGRWMGIAVCAYYIVQKRPAISGDNKDLTSFLNFYNPLVSHRVCLTRHRVFQESGDIFVDSSHQILVFYIPHVLLRLEECRHIGASFEHNKPDVQVKECGLRLVYEQDVKNFVQTLAQCMLESPDAECFYQNLLHQVEERVASKDFGFSSSLQRMPQPMPVLQPSIENIAEGCTSSATSPSSFTGFLATTRKEQYASIMSSESLIKARLEKNFDEGEIFNCCFAEREIPLWFCYENKQLMKIPLAPEVVNDPDWMGFALCGLFSFNRHPTAVRQSLGSIGIEFFQFRCLLHTNSCYRRLVCYGLLTTDNELVTLNQRAFIWVMFIPRTTLAHLWSKNTWAAFQLESSIPDLLAESFGIRLVFRHNMKELTQVLVQCSAPFDSLLNSCDPLVFYNIWENYPEAFIGTKNSYEDLHPQRLFISQEETSATAQYSYKEYLYPHNHFRCFHPSTIYNSCFPTRETPRWFNHHCRLGHSVTIEIPPNLCEDNSWLGLTLYASILIPRDPNNVVSVNSSHFLYCHFLTSKASLDNQILVCRTTYEEDNWLHRLFGLIWISYIPSEALKDMLHQCGHINASFVSDWPSVTVQKCGLRLLYQHDRLQFEQQLEHCNVYISAQRDFTCQGSHHGTRLELMEECMQVADKIISLVNKYDQLHFDGRSKYSYCFPPMEISCHSRDFNYQSNEPSVKIDLSNDFFNDSKWMGLILYAYFSSDEHQTAIIENPNSSIIHHLICLLETDIDVLEIHVHPTIKVEFTWLDIEGGFLWLCYIPCWQYLNRLNQSSCIKASIISDWPGIIVKKCGLCFYHVHDNWFQEIRDHCNMQYAYQDFYDQLTASYIEKTSRAKNQLSESHLSGFDRSCDYNFCYPPNKIPHWFYIRSDESHVTIRLPRKLNNRSTWKGVALCAVFSVRKDVADLNDIMNSKSSYKLICHLEASNGLSVKPRHIYWPTKEDLKISLLGGFTWLTYIPRGSFPDWLYDCAFIKFSFKTNCLGLKVQKCGLSLLYQNSVEKFKNCMNSKSDISAILNQKKLENRNKKMRYLIRNELGKNDTLDFDRCIFDNPGLPLSEILEWFNHRSDKPWLTIPLPPNLYNDSAWMGLVLCAYFALDVKTTAHFDIPNSDTNYGLIYHLETNVGGVRPLHGYRLTKEDLVMLQQGGCIWLSYIGCASFQNCLNQVSCIKASFTTGCPGLKVEKCGLRLLYNYDLEEFEQTISHSMNSSSDDWDLIHQLTIDDVNRDKQKHDGEGTSSRTSSSRKESNFGSQRGPIDPKDKGKRVLEK